MMLVWYRSVSGSERAQAQLILDRIISRFMFVIPAQPRIHASHIRHCQTVHSKKTRLLNIFRYLL